MKWFRRLIGKDTAANEEWYWCVKHQQVEPYAGCRSRDRLGPYDTPEEAAEALTRVEERNVWWDTDPRFNDPDEDDENDDDDAAETAGN